MIYRVLAVAIMLAIFAAPAFALDIDRHGNYTDGAAAKCKNFTGTDDNRGACTDWCTTYTAANPSASCNCDEGVCPDAPTAQVPASGPVVSH